jgi:hypothetical protein
MPDGHHGMAVDAGLTPEGQRHETSVHDDGALEGLVDPDADDKQHA